MAKAEAGERLLSIPLVLHGGDVFPADVDLEPSADRYVGYYENQYGEQLVFIHEKGGRPTLYHGDYGWESLAAEWPQISSLSSLSPWVSGNLILNQGEVLWLASCLQASGALLEKGGGVPDPLDRLALQLVQEASKRQNDHFDRQWSLRENALERWQERQSVPPSHEEDHYAEGAILVVLGLNAKQRRPRTGVTKEIRERIEREADEVVREVEQSRDSENPGMET
jgi:hypothetical protein